jgi:sulfur carrier protein ThiS
MAITVTVSLFGIHRAFLSPGLGQDGRMMLRYEQEAVTLADVMRDLGMAGDTVRIVFLRGTAIEADQLLKDGDELSFVSPVSGG